MYFEAEVQARYKIDPWTLEKNLRLVLPKYGVCEKRWTVPLFFLNFEIVSQNVSFPF